MCWFLVVQCGFCSGHGTVYQFYPIAGLLEVSLGFHSTRLPATMSVREECGLRSRNMSYRDHCVEPFGPYMSKVMRAVLNNFSAFCRWCGSVGFISTFPSTCTAAVCRWVSGGWVETQLFQVQAHGLLLVKGGLIPSGLGEMPTKVEGCKHLRVLFMSDGKMKHEMDRWFGATAM